MRSKRHEANDRPYRDEFNIAVMGLMAYSPTSYHMNEGWENREMLLEKAFIDQKFANELQHMKKFPRKLFFCFFLCIILCDKEYEVSCSMIQSHLQGAKGAPQRHLLLAKASDPNWVNPVGIGPQSWL